MKEHYSKAFFVVVLSVSTLLGGLGQFLFKEGLVNHGLTFAFYLAIGLAVYAISTLLYFYALSRRSLSWAYSFGGISYIFASVLAFLLLDESISPLRWLGIVVIAVGTAIIGLS